MKQLLSLTATLSLFLFTATAQAEQLTVDEIFAYFSEDISVVENSSTPINVVSNASNLYSSSGNHSMTDFEVFDFFSEEGEEIILNRDPTAIAHQTEDIFQGEVLNYFDIDA